MKRIILKNINSTQAFIEEVNTLSHFGEDILISYEEEIDEDIIKDLTLVLKTSCKHIAVSPLLFNANISTPLSFPLTKEYISYKESCKLLSSIQKNIPSYEIIRYASAYLILINGDILKRFSGFNNIKAKINNINKLNYADILNIYFEVMKFYGFSTILSNKSLLNIENINSSCLPTSLPKANIATFNPVKRFAPIKIKHKPKILLSFIGLTPNYNGTSTYALSTAKALIENYSNIYDFKIICERRFADFFDIKNRFKSSIYLEELEGIYDIGITFSQAFIWDSFIILNKHCYKIISTILDIIMYRVGFESFNLTDKPFLASINHSNAIITISQTVKDDINNALLSSKASDIYPILLGNLNINGTLRKEKNSFKKPFDKYILIFGNHFKHKALNDILPYLEKINKNFFIIGMHSNKHCKNISSAKSGFLTNEIINSLIKNSEAILFPSEYEGFGIPVIDALIFNKKIILRNNDINNELIENFDHNRSHSITFNYYDELKDILENEDFSKELPDISSKIRDINNIINETNDVINKVLNQNMDINFLIERDNFYNTISDSLNFALSSREILKQKLKNHPIAMKFAMFIKKVLKK